MGISSDKYIADWKSRLRREETKFFTNFRSGTPARRQVTLENCVRKLPPIFNYLPKSFNSAMKNWLYK